MPYGDGTGPNGTGPVGRGLGPCGRGGAIRRGGGFGRGSGMGRRAARAGNPPAPQDEVGALKACIDELGKRLGEKNEGK